MKKLPELRMNRREVQKAKKKVQKGKRLMPELRWIRKAMAYISRHLLPTLSDRFLGARLCVWSTDDLFL
jgi:hypothetical protein